MVLPAPIFSEIASTSKVSGKKFIAVIGGGPAGLMAAEAAANHNHHVVVFERLPSVGRKLLMAGRGGLNITHGEDFDQFQRRYGSSAARMRPYLDRFGPAQIVDWCHGLNIDTFAGSSRRVFPKDFKAAPLLRAWVKRLRAMGVEFRVRHRWLGWTDQQDLLFQSPNGAARQKPDATILALGGGSWPSLGSDGLWLDILAGRGLDCAPLAPSNCGFDVAWSEHLKTRFAGTPLKSVVVGVEELTAKGDIIITENGLEGGPIYMLSASLRDRIAQFGPSPLYLDLCPDRSLERLTDDLNAPRGSRSLSSHLKRCTALAAPALALLHESAPLELPQSPADLARLIKSLPLTVQRPRPLAEAISSAGGLRWQDVDDSLHITALPGYFACGEMVDWEAPTGGYLLTGCLATGFAAGNAAARYVGSDQP